MQKAGTMEEPDGSVRILIPLKPYTKKNSQQIFYKNRTSINGNIKKIPFISPSEQYKQYEADCAIFIRPLEIDAPVNVQAHYYMDTLKRVDLTNLNEALHDVLVKNHLLAEDNCRVIVATDGSRVFYDKENPRTEVLITRIKGTFPEEKEKKKGRNTKNGQ